ncbi:nuclear transport factor 2 family protein [Tenacibaculum sp. M341]|nr:nuclear transport factor 2 family protein [Tenacibaculum sp. M341]TCI90958.1 nuclear transport factor 2 family protein [Tenacibaculum sp. M341]
MFKESIKEIEYLITNYFEGLFFGDISKLESCFHNNVFIYGDIKGMDYLKSKNKYLEGVKNRKSPNDLKETFSMKIIGIEIMERIAMVKVHVPMLGYNYCDYLSLYNLEGKWMIVNKIFTHIE